MPRRSGTIALTALVLLASSACGASRAQSISGGGSSTGSARMTTAAATKVAVTAWVGHMVSFVAVDPTTLHKSETGFALQADQGQLKYDRSEGLPENQLQSTGSVEWVAIPAQSPALSLVARVETTDTPDTGSSLPARSEDSLALLQRTSPRAKWLISGWVDLYNPLSATMSQVQTIGKPLTSKAAAKLPIPAQKLPSAYESYLAGGTSSKFSPGPYTDQARTQFASDQSNWVADDTALTYPFTHGYVEAAYTLKGGDSLVFFGVTYDNLFTAKPGTCIYQNATNPNFPPAVPTGRYQSVTLDYAASVVAIEDPHSGMVSIVSGTMYEPSAATTTPTTAPSCL